MLKRVSLNQRDLAQLASGLRPLLDAVVRQRGSVRALAIPSTQVTALWVVPDDARRPSRVLIVEAQQALRLARRTLIPSSSLLRVVQRAHDRAVLATHPHPREA
jgi:hypothetical protein